MVVRPHAALAHTLVWELAGGFRGQAR